MATFSLFFGYKMKINVRRFAYMKINTYLCNVIKQKDVNFKGGGNTINSATWL